LLIQIESHLTNTEHSNDRSVIREYLDVSTVLKMEFGDKKYLTDDKLIVVVHLGGKNTYGEYFLIH